MASSWDATFWDIGGVILDHDSLYEGHQQFIESLSKEYEVDTAIALETWRDELGTYFREREKPAYRQARHGYQQTIDEIVGQHVPEEVWMPLYEDATTENIRPMPHLKDTVAALSSADIYLGVISDIDTWEAERILSLFDVDQYFQHVTTSEEVGKTKPHQSMFETALSKSDVLPDRSFMIGDRYLHDMKGGKEAGLRTVAHGVSTVDRLTPPDEGYEVEDEFIDYWITDLRHVLDIANVKTNYNSIS